MKTKTKVVPTWDIPQVSLIISLVLFLMIGIFFRFENLDQKVYWVDEVATSRRISGYTETEVEQKIFDGQLISVDNLRKYQYPNAEKSAADTINTLIREDSQHPPLYFVTLRSWVTLLGNSITNIRILSAIISLLTFPCMYWLCQELFQSKWVSWAAVALTAISPVHIVYAQEARQYSLWIVMTLLSSASLLRAIRKKKKINWLIYAATAAVGFYTHLFFGLIVIGHGIYVITTERFKFNRVSFSYLSSTLIALIAFAPWLWVLFTAPPKSGTGWMDDKPGLFSMAVRFAGVISRTFVDLGISPNDSIVSMLLLSPIILIVLALISYSLYFVFQNSEEHVWLFIFTLITVTSSVVIASYLILDKQIATTRYLLPVSLGTQLSVSYLLATKVQATIFSGKIWQQRFWRIAIILISFLGILSCTIRNQSEVWWNQIPERTQNMPQISQTINQADQPILITDANRGSDRWLLYSLSHSLNPNVRLQLLLESDLPVKKYDTGEIFLFEASEKLRTKIEGLYGARAKLVVGPLWQLESSE